MVHVKPRHVVAWFVTLDVFAMAVAVLAALIPDWRAYLVLAFPAIAVTANRLVPLAMGLDFDEVSDTELLILGIAYPVAIFISIIAPVMFIDGGLYYFLITALTYYVTFLSFPDCDQ